MTSEPRNTPVREKPLAIIPARGGSKRLPRKNLAVLAGKPLLGYAVESALESGVFDQVCVSTEDPEILRVAGEYGATPLERPHALATDQAQVKEVCEYVLNELAGRGLRYYEFGILLVTNPLRTATHVREAYEVFVREAADFVMSLVPFSHPPQRAVTVEDGRARPYFGMASMQRTQDLLPLYRHDGSIVFARCDAFLRERELYGKDVVPYHIPPEQSVDIDEAMDLKWAEFLLTAT